MKKVEKNAEEVAAEEVVEAVIEEVKISVPKFTRPEVVEELTEQNIKDIVESQEIEIKNLTNEIERKKACIAHYSKFLK
jgi:hypothetical protein